jgi:hypothetical protein
MHLCIRYSLAVIVTATVSACGSGSSSNKSPDLTWTENLYAPASTFAGYCGTIAQGFWLRSLFNEFYFWYEDIVDADPDNFFGITDYFDYLVTDDITASGKNKDQFSFIADAALLDLLIELGEEVGYGMRLSITKGDPDAVTVAFVAPGSTAANNNIGRGDKITLVDGFNFSAAQKENAYDGLYPYYEGQAHTLRVEHFGGGSTDISMHSTAVAMPAVGAEKIIGNVGYLQFNDHAAVAEAQLIAAFQNFKNGNISELILDLRYNSGGLLSIANQVSYMIAGAAKTTALNKTFETLRFNNRFYAEPIPFESTGRNSVGTLINLPTLNLSRVVIIGGQDTCSASESIINGLRGVGVDVTLIGSTTCGKPYGFKAFYNCQLAYLPVLFQGENDLGFGDYADGFKPNNSTDAFAQAVDGGCAVNDDFSKPLGDTTEMQLAAALEYINSGNCPAVPSSTLFSSAISTTTSALNTDTARHPALFKRAHGLRMLNDY